MTPNPNMTAHDRVKWRVLIQAAGEAGARPGVAARLAALRSALKDSGAWQMPDLGKGGAATTQAFLVLGRGFAAEAGEAMRAAMAPGLIALGDAVGDLLDGVVRAAPGDGEAGDGETRAPAWTERADLR